MIEIGGRPILWHRMKGFGAHGINDFVICCGYRGSSPIVGCATPTLLDTSLVPWPSPDASTIRARVTSPARVAIDRDHAVSLA